MSLSDIVSSIAQSVGITGVIIIIGALIKIKPLEINFWQWIARGIGNALNAGLKENIEEISTKVDMVEQQLEIHRAENAQDSAENWRGKILRFNDEIMEGKKHSQEFFDEILSCIDRYEAYCLTDTDFPNNKAQLAISNIKRHYSECLANGEFK